jgi:hypothetical protein
MLSIREPIERLTGDRIYINDEVWTCLSRLRKLQGPVLQMSWKSGKLFDMPKRWSIAS